MDKVCGRVILLGAGPGNIGLLTIHGAAVLRRADVVVYDRLVSPDILALASQSVRRIYVGKSPEHHAMAQEEINALLVREAQAGYLVVRLKGGDPFVFGRGGEEALALKAAGIPFEVVPGVTAGIGGAAWAGIPVTHRGMASSVTLVTGHEDPTKDESSLDYDALARCGTLVFYMGVGRLSEITQRLIEAGLAVDTPVAVVERATTSRQRTVVGTLTTITDCVADAGINPPAITIVGEVAKLHEQLDWAAALPLFGKAIVVTRTRRQAGQLVDALRNLGACALELPTIAIEPLDSGPLVLTLENIESYKWLVFTSPNGVERFFATLADQGRDSRCLAGLKVAAIGPGTAEALAGSGICADLVPPKAIAESLAEALTGAGVGQGARVLLPRAAGARDVLPETLRQAGAVVDEVHVYRATVPEWVDPAVLDMLTLGEADLITLTSSSTARHFVSLVEEKGGADLLEQVRHQTSFAAIGPITTQTAKELGLNVVVEAEEHTITGLVDAVCDWVAND